MKLGFVLPNVGPSATPEGIRRIAQLTERLEYDSVWVTDRHIKPKNPQDDYPASATGQWPETYKDVLDPMMSLVWAAGCTTRVRLGTSVLVMPMRNPFQLAKQFVTLDVLSGGRAIAGLGQGFSRDEYELVGVSRKGLGERADEFLDVMKSVWAGGSVAYDGEYFHIPRSDAGPKPIQRPPVYLAAYTEKTMKRVADAADGWFPAGFPAQVVADCMNMIRETARQKGRDGDALKVIYRAILHITDQPLGNDRAIFSGSLEQIRDDIAQVRDIARADELVFDTVSPEPRAIEQLEADAEQLKHLADGA
ncbi:TIGR03619 family F420-dependent LLM class oxidoreductase [Streptomyces sp. 7N604]|uniref:TIGR03619 family F420-dependent LLM class oxidoreductase n=1 Tax=Streptomyces sp. 7N604 TaxID=3457415 RepID=UPI003FCF1453